MSNLPSELKYAQSHEWAKLEGDNVVRVGITDHAQEALGDLVYIELPQVGNTVNAGEQCAVVESVKAASDIYSPVSGEVVEVNDAVVDGPQIVNNDAYSSWFFCVRVGDPTELEKLMDAETYQGSIEE